MQALRTAGVDVLVSAVTPPEDVEMELVGEAGTAERSSLRFVRFPIEDRGIPDLTDARRVLRSIYAALERGRHVAVHCRQGIGRSSLIAASLMTMSGIDPADAFERLQVVRGRPVPDTEEQREWVLSLAEGWLRGSEPPT